MKYDSYIFDIDGVLIDTSQSFNQAVLEAVKTETGSDRFTSQELSGLKSITGFNNDWHAAIAGAGWVSFYRDQTFHEYIGEILIHGSGLEGVREFLPEVTPIFEKRVTRLVQEAYGGTTACKSLYGFSPEMIQIPGYWRTEKPLVPNSFFPNMNKKLGIVTGRNRAELDLAFQVLDWHLPDSQVAWSHDPALDKPNPEKLFGIVEELGTVAPLYFGDTEDDLNLVKNYRNQRGKTMDFCFVGPDRELPDYAFRVESVSDFLRKLESQND